MTEVGWGDLSQAGSGAVRMMTIPALNCDAGFIILIILIILWIRNSWKIRIPHIVEKIQPLPHQSDLLDNNELISFQLSARSSFERLDILRMPDSQKSLPSPEAIGSDWTNFSRHGFRRSQPEAVGSDWTNFSRHDFRTSQPLFSAVSTPVESRSNELART